MKSKKIFNPDSTEAFDEARIFGGNPNGIINFNKTNHKWAKEIYDLMKGRTWFPGQISIIKDKANYSKLTPAKKRSFDLVLAQLIANDSMQANQLMDKINGMVTSPVVNACLSVQSMEECLIEGHELLLSDGSWKDISEITKKDIVGCVDVDKRELIFDLPTRTHKYDYTGNLHVLEGRYVSQVVTDDHRLPLIGKKGEVVTVRGSDLTDTERVDEGFMTCVINQNGFTFKDTSRGSVKHTIEEVTSTPVYCITVPTGYFLVKHDGKISVTGNCNHAFSYAVMAEDICLDTDRIYELEKHDPELARKNKAIKDMYEAVYKEDEEDGGNYEPTLEDKMLVLVGNQILEELVFPGGFAAIYTLEPELPGSASMITEINFLSLPTVKAVA